MSPVSLALLVLFPGRVGQPIPYTEGTTVYRGRFEKTAWGHKAAVQLDARPIGPLVITTDSLCWLGIRTRYSAAYYTVRQCFTFSAHSVYLTKDLIRSFNAF